jgi:hypothetical protein
MMLKHVSLIVIVLLGAGAAQARQSGTGGARPSGREYAVNLT